MKDSWRKSLLKTLSWRVIATLITVSVVYIYTGEALLSFGIGAMDMLLKIVVYYLHERAWIKVNWGAHPMIDHAPAPGD